MLIVNKMKLIKPDVSIEEAMKEPEKWIPDGIYCYTPNCDGDSIFEETIYENRMRHIKYLNQMGAKIDLDNKIAIIHGKTNLKGEKVEATDLRAGAAMMLAGMIADGVTEISNIEHILRGYENIVEKLSAVGASIKIIEE